MTIVFMMFIFHNIAISRASFVHICLFLAHSCTRVRKYEPQF